jgi:hypothetical protein
MVMYGLYRDCKDLPDRDQRVEAAILGGLEIQ